MDIRTLPLELIKSLDTRPGIQASYCICALKVFALGRRLVLRALGTGTLVVVASVAAAGAPAHEAAGVTIHPEQWPTVQRPIAPDPALEARITALMAGMTPEQKVGQLIQPDIASITPEDLRHFDFGSILNGGNSSPNGNEFAPPSEWLALADRFYDAAMDPVHGPHPIPILWGTDAVHGHNNIVGATIFPHNIGLGAARDPSLMTRIGEITALEVRATGLDWSFGPTLAVVRDFRWGRTYESYSEKPDIVREYAAAMLLGLQGKPGTPQFLDSSHVLASPKHFVGDGGTRGKDQGNNVSSETELRDVDAAGYPPAIAAGAQIVMASFSSWQGVRMSANEPLLTGILKGRMGFDGFVVGDWNSHASVAGCTQYNCAAALKAGLDLYMAPDSWRELYKNTLAQVRSGEISSTRVDDAVRRVLRVKLRAHLLDEGRPSSRPLAGRFDLLGAPEHRAVARQAARESLVLLKNAHHLLPLSPHTHVLVAGDGADNIGKQSGGWTITWQGTGVSNKDFPHGESIYSGIHAAVTAAGGTAELSVAGESRTRPDVAIVVFGENPYAEFQGDIPTSEYSPGAKPDLALLRKLHASGIPVVTVFLSGRPLWVNPEINASDAFVAAWLPGSEGGGIADVIFKAANGSVPYDFHGKLSFSWPRTPQQTGAPVRADDPPLFPYGYGLRYHDDGDLKTLPEDAGTTAPAAIDTHVFFAAGRPGAGWAWFAGAGVAMSGTDKSAQEDARQVSWQGPSAAVGLSGSTPIDLQREANGQLSLAFDYRINAPVATNITLAIECGPNCRASIPIAHALTSTTTPGQWGHIKVPLVCFARSGADMTRITTPFALQATGPLTLGLANIRLESGLDGELACGAR
jgi:beta-glucosidase